MSRVKMILVGGFLGAGKTTLLARAAERLAAGGRRVGLITNDQAANLVDTEVLRQGGQEVKEVSGACFCCAFNKLLYVCDNLINLSHPDVIIAEPVGSCTDLSATVLQPLKKYCRDRFDLAPYSVLVDPDKLQESLDAGEAEDLTQAVRYIYRKQLQEADLIVLNKIDAMSPDRAAEIDAVLGREFPGVPVAAVSALRGTGVEEWLGRVLSGGTAGGRIVEVDYDTYADGEAALGWLNAAVELSAERPTDPPTDWKAFALDFLRRSQGRIRETGGEIAHFKVLLTARDVQIQANLTSNTAEPTVQGEATTPATPGEAGTAPGEATGAQGEAAGASYATLVVNARVRTSPEELKAVVEDCLRLAAGESIAVHIAELSSFRPGRPQPVHRFREVVGPESAE